MSDPRLAKLVAARKMTISLSAMIVWFCIEMT
jgi:hypothetical protein